MKGEIFDGKKYFSARYLDSDVIKQAWEILDNGLTIELIWEALHLIEVYFVLRIMSHILLLAKFSLFGVKTNSFDLNKQGLTQEGFIQDMKTVNGFFEAGKFRPRQIFDIYYISDTINKRGQKIMNFEKDAGLYGDFFMGPDCVSIRPLVPYVTETLTSSYCC